MTTQKQNVFEAAIQLEQGHMEYQLDALREAYRVQLQILNELTKELNQSQERSTTLREEVNNKNLIANALSQHLGRYTLLVEKAESLVSYQVDYRQRQEYYKSKLDDIQKAAKSANSRKI